MTDAVVRDPGTAAQAAARARADPDAHVAVVDGPADRAAVLSGFGAALSFPEYYGRNLDALEEQTQGYAGRLKVQLPGPWTLAATVERPRGDRLLADHGARRDLAQALAAGVAAHLEDVARRVPGAALVLQLDEPALAAVMAGRVPTASGFGKHRTVAPPEASEALAWVLDAAHAVRGVGPDVTTVVHSCADQVPVRLLRDAGADAVSVDLAALDPAAHEALAESLEAGAPVHLGVVPATGAAAPAVGPVLDRVRSWLDMLGLDPDGVGDQLVLTPACGTAGASAAYAREVLGRLREAAAELGTELGADLGPA